jgi:hypothetical protein
MPVAQALPKGLKFDSGPHAVPLVMSDWLRGRVCGFPWAPAQLAASSETAATATTPMLTANFLRLTMCVTSTGPRGPDWFFISRRRNSGSSYDVSVPGCFLRVVATYAPVRKRALPASLTRAPAETCQPSCRRLAAGCGREEVPNGGRRKRWERLRLFGGCQFGAGCGWRWRYP